MRNELDVLLDKIPDAALRADVRSQVERVRAKRNFGLVFESHLPERVRLPGHPIRVGVNVALRDDPNSPAFEVIAIEGRTVTMRKAQNPDGSVLSEKRVAGPSNETAQIDALVVIADFGEPVFPGLRHLGSVDRGGDKPAHIVIKGENHHVLEALQFSHAGKVDCIYIDPPYNTGARDWKYDNNYVDDTDAYRHSKWLAFMERRLILARELLNPEHSVLIVTIDEKEYLRLGLLLGQIFPTAKQQMVSIVTNPSGTSREGLSRVEEYAFFLFIGAATPARTNDNLLTGSPDDEERPVVLPWESLLRRGNAWYRAARKNLCYPVLIEPQTRRIVGAGPPSTEMTSRIVPRRSTGILRPGRCAPTVGLASGGKKRPHLCR